MKESKDLGTGYLDKISYYIDKNRLQAFYNLFLLTLVIIMGSFTVAALDSVTVEVDIPPRGKIVVKNDRANQLYYELWAEHYSNNKEYYARDMKGKKVAKEFTFSIIDFDYTNVEQKYAEFLKRYRKVKLIKEQHIFKNFVLNVKKKTISQKFEVEKIETKLFNNGRKAVSTITGVAMQTFGTVKKKPKECEYSIGFERIGGKIYGTSLSTDCF